jgi:zinc transport system substrate-binding protein
LVVNGFSGIEEGADPHVWLSPPLARTLVGNLARAMTGALPKQASTFQARADSLLATISELDAEIRSIFAIVPDRTFYVFHDAWGAFAEAYGLQQVAIEQQGHEPGPERIAALIEAARRDSVRSIFVEPQFSRQSAELVAAEIGVRVVALDPLAADWSDNLIRVAHAIAEGMGP